MLRLSLSRMFKSYDCNDGCYHGDIPESYMELLRGSMKQEEVNQIWVSMCHLHQQLLAESVSSARLKLYFFELSKLIDEFDNPANKNFKGDFLLIWQMSRESDDLKCAFEEASLIESDAIIQLMFEKPFAGFIIDEGVTNWISSAQLNRINRGKRARIEEPEKTTPKPNKTLKIYGPVDEVKNFTIPFTQIRWMINAENYIQAGIPIRIVGPLQSGKTSFLKYIQAQEES
jgi:hypothetical protein